MNDLHIFQSEQFGTIRTVMQNDEPWFVAADVCRALELGNVSMAIERLDEDERTLISIEGASNGLPVNAVNEPGLYTLILGSRKPEAKAFKRWITHEVLPAIRKTGIYAAPGAMTSALAEMHSAMGMMQRMLCEMKWLAPKGYSLDRVLAAKADGTLDAHHLRGHGNIARRLLDREKIGRKITVYLIEEDLTMEEFSAQVGVDKRSVFRWRSGENAPAGERLAKLCEVLGCDVSDLLI